MIKINFKIYPNYEIGCGEDIELVTKVVGYATLSDGKTYSDAVPVYDDGAIDEAKAELVRGFEKTQNFIDKKT